MVRAIVFGCAAVIVGMAVPAIATAEPAKDSLAAQLRDQGYRCSKAISAKRDRRRSRPDQAVWILRCNREVYRMRLTPDMAARVERIR
jgi:hypothetical protein